ncbi:MAG: glycosyltransferase [Deltaproteobacteria bacterium]|nr:glycosyltransferase [Deltaproteobacteria bacterium]
MQSTRKPTYQRNSNLISRLKGYRVALMLPCLDEEHTLAKVIRDFRAEIPFLDIYVFDNNSSDRSREIALRENAKVVRVQKQGKGYVVRKMFETVEADIYILVDSDDTYDVKGIWQLIEPVLNEEADMTVASRLSDHSSGAFRKFHRFGNSLIIRLINMIFRSSLTDICSGYRVMSRNFIKNIPLLRDGFEVETELTVYSLIWGFAIKEVPLAYRDRPPNSQSKLRTFRDGYKVLLTIVWLARDLRPLLFFGIAAIAILLGMMVPIAHYYPDALLTQFFLALVSVSLLTSGLILNSINVKFSELHVLYRRQTSTTISPADLTTLSASRVK